MLRNCRQQCRQDHLRHAVSRRIFVVVRAMDNRLHYASPLLEMVWRELENNNATPNPLAPSSAAS